MPQLLTPTFPHILKETPMQYKTMVLELIQQRQEMHEELRKKRTLLQTVNLYAQELKRKHEAWKAVLSPARPGSDPSQIASEALEIALKDLEDSLPTGSLPDEDEAISIEEAMAFFLRHTPPA
jgi:hypothetical protein